MATVKLATLAIRTVAKPISAQLKNQAKQFVVSRPDAFFFGIRHETFRSICVSLAQKMHTAEISLRTNILGEPARQHVRPLSETRAIENGANALAEGFLFAVAAALIIGETYRTSRNQSKRRDDVDERLEELASSIASLKASVEALTKSQEEFEGERARNDELARIVERMVEIGLRGGWAEFESTPLKVPRVELVPEPLRSRNGYLGSSSKDVSPDSPSIPSSSS
ncbi:optic atrophy 3 protein-domain-containing protein [Phlebopus sp. FC_14]|nr:optic atrophy 3 protein-domain-containing protein [Phlebopus sp. FC_14]